jgi:hypothetical protein
MLIKEKILFSKEECQSILQNINKWDDTIISVKLDSKFSKLGGVMKSFNAIFDDDSMWIKNRLLDWINELDGIFEIDTNTELRAYYRKYVKGDYFVKHNDHVDGGINQMYTIGIMLHSSPDLIGGDLKFYSNESVIGIDFKIGNVYIFNSGIPHSVDLIELGERITLMIFVGGRHLQKNTKLI